MQTSQLHSAVVESLHQVAQRVYVARLRVADPMEFIAGQYGSFVIDQKTRRNFSFATAPNGEMFEICADTTPMGPGSVWLMNLTAGDSVTFLGPLGRFTVDYQSPNERVFIATGTGIAPIRAMIAESLAREPDRKARLYFGLRFEDDIFWDKEFAQLTKIHTSFTYHLTLSQPGSAWKGKRGRITDYVFEHDHLDQCDFYLCGSREMVRDMTNRLLKSNIEEMQIKTELFY